MSKRNTVVRSMHDLGLATWFGGALMGAVGLNGATAHAKDPQERLRLSSMGWGRWTPVQIAAVGAHVIGGFGLAGGNNGCLGVQQGGRANTIVNTATPALAGVMVVMGAQQGEQQRPLAGFLRH